MVAGCAAATAADHDPGDRLARGFLLRVPLAAEVRERALDHARRTTIPSAAWYDDGLAAGRGRAGLAAGDADLPPFRPPAHPLQLLGDHRGRDADREPAGHAARLAVLVLVSAVLSNLGQYLSIWIIEPDVAAPLRRALGRRLRTLRLPLDEGQYEPEQGMILHPNTVSTMLIWLVLCMTGLLGPIANAAHVVGPGGRDRLRRAVGSKLRFDHPHCIRGAHDHETRIRLGDPAGIHAGAGPELRPRGGVLERRADVLAAGQGRAAVRGRHAPRRDRPVAGRDREDPGPAGDPPGVDLGPGLLPQPAVGRPRPRRRSPSPISAR